MPAASPPLHVVSNRWGRWQVRREGEDEPLSEHGNATDAERAAIRYAREAGARRIVVHDRYGRIRQSPR